MKKILIIVCAVFITTSIVRAQDIKIRSVDNQNQPKMIIGIKDSLNPDVYIDGEKYNQKILSLIDPDKIESMRVVTDEKELKKYNAEHGVILVTTKKINTDEKIRVRAFGNTENKTPVIVIDGKVASQEELSKLAPSDVETITVKKDEKAKEQYNAPNGVILIEYKDRLSVVLIEIELKQVWYFPGLFLFYHFIKCSKLLSFRAKRARLND